MSNNDQFDDLNDFDDFDDIGDDLEPVSEEGVSGEDGWDQLDGETDQEGHAGPLKKTAGKKKSGLFNLLLIGGIVAAGGGFMVLQMGSKAPAPAPVLEQQEPLISSPVAEIQNPPSAPPMPAPMSQPEAADIEVMAPPASPAPVPEMSGAQPNAAEAALRMPKAEDILLKNTPASPAEADGAVLVPAPQAPVTGMVESSGTLPLESVPAVNGTALPEINQVMEKLDALSVRLGTLERTLDAYRQEKAPVSDSPAPATAAQIIDLQQALASVESRLEQLSAPKNNPVSQPERAPSPPPVAVKPKPQILGQGIRTDATETEETVNVEQSRPARQTAPVQWVLKGAQPGRAMVAKAGENDLRPVEVGDTLLGIGRVTAILYQDGKWLVRGTEGSISQ